MRTVRDRVQPRRSPVLGWYQFGQCRLVRSQHGGEAVPVGVRFWVSGGVWRPSVADWPTFAHHSTGGGDDLGSFVTGLFRTKAKTRESDNRLKKGSPLLDRAVP